MPVSAADDKSSAPAPRKILALRSRKTPNKGPPKSTDEIDGSLLHSDPLPYVHPSTMLPRPHQWPANPNVVSLLYLGPAVPPGHFATGMISFKPFNHEHGVITHRVPAHVPIARVNTIRVSLLCSRLQVHHSHTPQLLLNANGIKPRTHALLRDPTHIYVYTAPLIFFLTAPSKYDKRQFGEYMVMESYDIIADPETDTKGMYLYKFENKDARGLPCFAVFAWDGDCDPVVAWEIWMRKWGEDLRTGKVVAV